MTCHALREFNILFLIFERQFFVAVFCVAYLSCRIQRRRIEQRSHHTLKQTARYRASVPFRKQIIVPIRNDFRADYARLLLSFVFAQKRKAGWLRTAYNYINTLKSSMSIKNRPHFSVQEKPYKLHIKFFKRLVAHRQVDKRLFVDYAFIVREGIEARFAVI